MDKTALVTGASRGIGRAIARALQNEGYSLAVVGRDRAALEDAVPGALAIEADLTDPTSPEAVFKRFGRRFTALHVLVNNAGTVASGPIGSYDGADWDRVMGLNARAPFFLMQQALPYLRAAKHGRIINIGSAVSKKGYADQALYAASKHALLGMTKSAARDLAVDGIRVHAILPGGVATDMVRRVRPDINESELIAPDEIARTVVWLLSMQGNAVTDEVVLRRATKPAWD